MKQLKYILFIFLLVQPVSNMWAINYRFDLTNSKTGKGSKEVIPISVNTIYGNNSSYGYDLGTIPKNQAPFFFSVDLPEGNYWVTLTLGSLSDESCTTVKSESRRLMLENIKTSRGKLSVQTFAVNIRNTTINTTDSVKIKPREIGELIWDNKLTLEFNGSKPILSYIQIQKANDLTTVFLAGNSTVVDEGNEPWCGWGQMFPRFFDWQVAVANYAESGEAANTFVSSKRFAKIMTQIKQGDYLFIEFGHNDQKQKGEGKGAYFSYKQDLKYLIDQAKSKGAIPVLITPMHRRRFDQQGKVINTHGEHPAAMKQLAMEENISLIDLHAMSKILYEAWGIENSKRAFVHYPAHTFPNQDKILEDNTHFNSYGGYQIAKCVLKGIIDANLPLKKHIRKEVKIFDPAHPDDMAKWNVPPTPFWSLQKPDGD